MTRQSRVPFSLTSPSGRAALLFIAIVCAAESRAEPSAREQALANERFPVNALHMEAQWGVNCSLAIADVRTMAEEGVARSTSTDHGIAVEDLRQALIHCGYIYNTPGVQTYRGCPDFKQWEGWLSGNSALPSGCQ